MERACLKIEQIGVAKKELMEVRDLEVIEAAGTPEERAARAEAQKRVRDALFATPAPAPKKPCSADDKCTCKGAAPYCKVCVRVRVAPGA